MADAGDALALQRGRRAHQRARGGEEHPLPHALPQAAEYVPREHAGRAAAAGAARVRVLRRAVEDQHAAVGVGRAEVDAAHAHELARDVPPDEAQVAGDDGVVVGGRAARVPEMRRERVAGRGGHGGAHVVRVGYPGVHDAPGGHEGDVGPRPRVAEDERPRARHRPLAGGRAHAAVFQREAELPLRRAEVRARQRCNFFRPAAVYQK